MDVVTYSGLKHYHRRLMEKLYNIEESLGSNIVAITPEPISEDFINNLN